MQPRRKRRFPAESRDLAVELQERLLRKVFGFSGIARHPETKGIYPPFVESIEIFESNGVAGFRLLDRLGLIEARIGRTPNRGSGRCRFGSCRRQCWNGATLSKTLMHPSCCPLYQIGRIEDICGKLLKRFIK